MSDMTIIHRYDDKVPGAWDNFIKAMHSGEQFECDEEMYFYWLEVLPPVFMGQRVALPTGETIHAEFGFAEGAEPITYFWRKDSRFFGCRSNVINRHG